MRLSDLQENQKGIIVRISGKSAFRRRIAEMGFVKGQEIKVIRNAPLKDPIEYQIMGYDVSLRRKEAAGVEVVMEDSDLPVKPDFTINEGRPFLAHLGEKKIKVALVGNPNSGKTTFFNYASGANEHVGNYAGVTIGTKSAYFIHSGYRIEMTDLPGTYSLSTYSPEEKFVRNHLIEQAPDIVLNVVDASNLERNLFLTTQLIDLELRTVIGLNMYDDLERSGSVLKHDELGRMMGIPVIPTVASRGIGLNELLDKLIQVYEGTCKTSRRIQIHYNLDLELEIDAFQKKLKETKIKFMALSNRYIAIKLIEGETEMEEWIRHQKKGKKLIRFAEEARKRLNENLPESLETVLVDARYGFIDGALKRTLDQSNTKKRQRLEVDDILTHKVWGYPIFLFILWLIFQATFVLGQYPMDWIDAGVGALGNFVDSIMANGPLKSLLINGIIGGVGGVIIFLPNILILFFAIALLEDTGYMARAAFLMDKLMQKMGLQGKSFIPLIMGFGCNVPAIMATRTLENKNHRLLTMLINPFMSCSARLPVYILVIGAVFPQHAGTMLFGIYTFGILLAVGVSVLLNKWMIKTDNVPFVMELPPYRRPTLRASLRHMWFRAVQYLKKMGGLILLASIIIWALGHYPVQVDYSRDYPAELSELNQKYTETLSQTTDPDDQKALTIDYTLAVKAIENLRISEHQKLSYIGQIGHFIEPVMRPLGFDWKMSVALLTGIAAKEVVISTMGVLYQSDLNDDDGGSNLMDKMNEQVYSSGKFEGEKVFTPLVSLAFLIFVLVYFPCVAVVAAIKNESGEWKWAMFSIVLTTSLAWILSFLVYQIGLIFV